MRLKKEYKLILSTDARDFSEKVSMHLNDGWELYGGTMITRGPYMSQALIRETSVV